MPLLLLPNLLSEEGAIDQAFPPSVAIAVQTIQGLIVESEKEGRHYLKRFIPHFREIPLLVLNEHTVSYEELLTPLLKGERWGLISDAGLPCLADPGAELIFRAKKKGIEIVAYPGPCSILMALQLSGLSAQNFTFHGYPPREQEMLLPFLRSLGKKTTHLFIEAPYRNQKLLETLIGTLKEDALFCVACDLTLPTQEVLTRSIAEWKKAARPNIHKRPSIFLIAS